MVNEADDIKLENDNVPTIQEPKKKSSYETAMDGLNTKTHAEEVRKEKRIGFYRLKHSIGKGAFGVVKLGIHTITKCNVAIKIVDKGRLSVRETKTLIREMHLLDQMHHPNILRLYEVKETAGKMFIVMEYASKGDLSHYLNEICPNGRMQDSAACRVFVQVMAAIMHCHSKDIVHRDIKAENLLFDENMNVKLCDFGLSRSFIPDQLLTTWCGSPHYCAPEIFEQVPYSGVEFDIWSLGVLLFLMVAGRMPFEAKSVAKIKGRVLACDYKIPDIVPTPIQDVINAMLKLNPNDRSSLVDLKQFEWFKDAVFPEEEKVLPTPTDERAQEEDDSDSIVDEFEESEVLARMRDIGISYSTLQTSQMEKQSRSSVVGMYRLLSHKIQKEAAQEEVEEVIVEKKPAPTPKSFTCSLL